MNRSDFWIDNADKRWAPRGGEDPTFRSHARSMASEDFSKMVVNIAEHLKLNKKDYLLDIGGAVGAISMELHHLVSQIKVIDPSKEMIKDGKKLAKDRKINNISFVESKLPMLSNIKTNSYNKIMCGGMVLNYINDKEIKPSLINVRRVMKKNSKALFFHQYESSNTNRFANRFANSNPAIKHLMENLLAKANYYEIKKISEKNGFKNIKRVYVPYAESFGDLVAEKSFSFMLST